MIRFINCVRRRADISSEQFRQFWNDPKFDALINRVMERRFAVAQRAQFGTMRSVDAGDAGVSETVR